MRNEVNVHRTKIGVVGAGSWGTALANHLAVKGFQLDHWAFEKEVAEQIRTIRENKTFLPGCPLSLNITPSNDLSKVVADKDLVLVVVPSHVLRATSLKMASSLAENTILVTASKGIENKTFLTMTDVLKQTVPSLIDENLAALSGPSFAREVVNQIPTMVTVASKSTQTAQYVQNVFATPLFRVYTNNDMIGVELGGAVKNIIALASGIIGGLKMGLNTRAAIIARGLLEIRRLGMKMGAHPDTFYGLSGIGDLTLTCNSEVSRNYTVGKKIGEGSKLTDILSEMKMVAEGVKTTQSVYNLSVKLGVEMPITDQVYQILFNDVPPHDAIHQLMTRDLKGELDY